MKEYDVFIIGSGMAGMTIANKCASEGLKVGITDELSYGGTCALRGCDPKKSDHRCYGSSGLCQKA